MWGWTWPKMGSVLLTAVFIALQFATGLANPDSKRLYDDLLSNYNRLIRPVGNNSDRLTVKMGLRLSQLIDVPLDTVRGNRSRDSFKVFFDRSFRMTISSQSLSWPVCLETDLGTVFFIK
uniref:Neurotransmitter-gated ion-channel ligand-binding domain-containing protein n=1 Tax=Anopheles culicifacies TaxID=139723 RepID=A0A182MQE8_9DIPT